MRESTVQRVFEQFREAEPLRVGPQSAILSDRIRIARFVEAGAGFRQRRRAPKNQGRESDEAGPHERLSVAPGPQLRGCSRLDDLSDEEQRAGWIVADQEQKWSVGLDDF